MPQPKNTGQNPDEGISDFRISGQFFIKENYYNSRTSKDIDMKLGLVPKFDTRNTITSKKLTMTSCQEVVTLLLEQSGSRIPNAWF